MNSVNCYENRGSAVSSPTPPPPPRLSPPLSILRKCSLGTRARSPSVETNDKYIILLDLHMRPPRQSWADRLIAQYFAAVLAERAGLDSTKDTPPGDESSAGQSGARGTHPHASARL